MAPAMSSRNLAAAAIMARALSLTDDGAWPSAQLMVLSAVALVDAVRDHFHQVMTCSLIRPQHGASLLRERQRLLSGDWKCVQIDSAHRGQSGDAVELDDFAESRMGINRCANCAGSLGRNCLDVVRISQVRANPLGHVFARNFIALIAKRLRGKW